MSGIERILKLKEIINPSLSLEDISCLFEVITSFLKESDTDYDLIKDEFLIMFDIKESKYPHFLKIGDDSIDYGTGKIESANIILIMDLSTLSDLAFGRLEIIIAVFNEKIKFIGDLSKIVSFFEIFYFSLNYYGILKDEERTPPIEIKEMNELLEIYHIGSLIGEPYHISSFLKLISLYANNCYLGQEQISGKAIQIYLHIIDVGDFKIEICNDKFTWKYGIPKNFTLKIESNLKNFIDIILNRDTITSFMAGNLKLEGVNAIPDSIFFQELIVKFLDFLGLGEL